MGNLASPKEVINQAITELGGEAVEDSFDSIRSKGLLKTFQRTATRLLAANNWQFNLRRVQLARLEEKPVSEWQFKYQLPKDTLSVIGHYHTKDSTIRLDGARYEQQGNFLLTNQDQIFTTYQAYIEPQDYPFYFDDFIVISVAEAMARTETGESANSNLSLIRARARQAFKDAVAADQKGNRARYRGRSDVESAHYGGNR